MSSHTPFTTEPTQIIEGQYVDQRKLMNLLKDLYGTSDEGENNFYVELRLNRYKIYPLEHAVDVPMLTQDQIQDCHARWRW